MKKEELKRKMLAAAEAEQRAAAGSTPARREDEPSASADAGGGVVIPVEQTTPELSDAVLAALAARPDPGFVLYGGRPHRVVSREGRAALEPHTRESLLGHLGRALRFDRCDREGRVRPSDPPRRLVDDLLSLPAFPEGIPAVRWIKSAPLLTADGELVSAPGLHPEHECYLDVDPALEGIALPAEISARDLDRAAQTILDPFDDFPVDEHSVANLVALQFTMAFRELVRGVTPLFVVDANAPGTGKGLLCSVLSMIAYGVDAEFSPGNVNSEEIRKRLFAVAAQGARMHVLDNVEHTVWSADLSAFLTAARYSDRRLGESATYTYPNTLVTLATGNNVRIGGDIARRSVLIRLVSAHARPEERDGFRYPAVVSHVRRRRRRILQAMYTVAAAWLRDGKPVPDNCPQMGSFEAWVRFSAGILHTLGATGLLDNRDLLRVRDQDSEDYELMLSRARRHFGDRAFTARDLQGALDPDDFPSALGGSQHGSLSKRMGRLLTRIEGRAFGEEELTVRHHRTVDKTKQYRVEAKPGSAPGDTPGPEDRAADKSDGQQHKGNRDA